VGTCASDQAKEGGEESGREKEILEEKGGGGDGGEEMERLSGKNFNADPAPMEPAVTVSGVQDSSEHL
jgi:hypothetical protein